ncbi:integral membrane sensor hybrid histidine kinase [Solidesulfovibrio carbinoliphilus subsp. oakridgensis]|uniref:Sensory/regulatory protein RpfC n=1 Tax=Solidesulfovibrio carbinoliphilus subsp. oakridgensis TaxID=694327 RepID=G7Q8Q0_9BACT|nr:CHASE4 domain-containing protein [Solidesulfovibrio carbinoliphilus]EHJ49137.1 integral membrane sensor hybrid histidine kinase [Solidesulfovibrio carbinoliphilus subsp. oakridgensis]
MIRISIRKFTLLGLCLGTVLFFALYIAINSYLLKKTFTNFENNSLANDVVRMSNALDEEIHKLDELILDWAIWDDSALFMQGKMKNYTKSNLNDRTLDSLHLSFIMFVDNRGRIVWSRSESGEENYVDGVPQPVKQLIFDKTSILGGATQETRIHGIANLPQQLLIIASCPILDSEAKGPKQGTLIMGRQITAATLEKVSERVRLKFDLERKTDPLPDTMRAYIRTISPEAGNAAIDIYDIDENSLIGVMAFQDITGEASLRLMVFGDKDIVHRGAAVTLHSSILLAIGGAILIGSILFLVERRILRRIISIKKQITQINSGSNASSSPPRILVSGDDEINTLAQDINAYIREIDNYRTNLETIIFERTNDLQQKILENEQYQKELKLAKDLAEEANKTKTDFLAKVTHEIRTPLNSIKGMNDYLLSTSLNDDQRECLSIIKESSNHLLTIVNDLLDLSKIEAGQLVFEHIDFALKQLIESTIRILQPLANQKKLDLHVAYEGDADIVVRGDPSRIRQVLFNLANNALKFTQTGTVGIVASVAWQESLDAYAITISIKDTGIGIAAEALQRIFQPFVQSDNSTSRKFGGTGLGLSICNQLIALMGGTIAVSSRPGQGSTFTFTLQLQRGDANRVPARGAAGFFPYTPLDRLTILVVDDNELNLGVAKRVFSLLNQEPVLALGGRQALDLLKTAVFDIVFLDIEMPEINGLEVTRIIRSGKATPLNQDTHIVAMTAYSLDTIREQCLQQGMNDFITKPLDPDVIFAKLLSLGRTAMPACPDGPADDSARQDADPASLLRSLAVLNVESALRKLGADKELYLDLCRGFLEKFNGERFDVLYLTHHPEPRDLSLHIHSLKGISLQIGADRLSFLTQRLEKKIACGESDIHRDLLLLKDQIAVVETRLRELVREEEEEGRAQPLPQE